MLLWPSREPWWPILNPKQESVSRGQGPGLGVGWGIQAGWRHPQGSMGSSLGLAPAALVGGAQTSPHHACQVPCAPHSHAASQNWEQRLRGVAFCFGPPVHGLCPFHLLAQCPVLGYAVGKAGGAWPCLILPARLLCPAPPCPHTPRVSLVGKKTPPCPGCWNRSEHRGKLCLERPLLVRLFPVALEA